MTTEAGVLRTEGLSKSFGSLGVARDISIVLPPGARHALIGPNGAGKTSLVNLITGQLQPDSGRVLLAGADVTAMPRAARVKAGLARTFQINALFPDLTPIESVMLAVWIQSARVMLVSRSPSFGSALTSSIARVSACLLRESP